jgi:hypothetical protein
MSIFRDDVVGAVEVSTKYVSGRWVILLHAQKSQEPEESMSSRREQRDLRDLGVERGWYAEIP